MMSSQTDARDEIELALNRLQPSAISSLLSVISRLCPKCGTMMAIRSSWTTNGIRMARMKCADCEIYVKRKV